MNRSKLEEKELKTSGRGPEESAEKELFDKFLAGDHQAFASILKRYRGKALNFAYRFLGDMDDAEDAAQDCFIKIYRSRDNFDPERPFEPWLYRILTNCCRDRMRHQSRFADFMDRLKVEHDLDSSDKSDKLSFEHNPGNYAEILAAALQRLSTEKREIITLRFDQDLSYDDIAGALGVSQGTVMSRLFRAKKDLERILKNMGINKQ